MRRGYTLMEMVLVLAIMVIAAAIAVPVVQTMLDDANMTAGADQMRARLADARARALDSGTPWKLAYQPGSGVYQYAAESDDASWSDTGSDEKETQDFVRGKLPKHVVMAVNRDDIAGAQGDGTATGGWTTLAVFLGDGSARDDGMVYVGKHGIMPLRLRVRGLTGAVTVDVPIQVRDNP